MFLKIKNGHDLRRDAIKRNLFFSRWVFAVPPLFGNSIPLASTMLSRGAFAFEVREMERRYQQFYLSSTVDRLRPFVYFLVVPIRLSLLAYENLNAQNWNRAKFIFLLIRIFVTSVFLALLSKKCGKENNYWRGLALLWIVRICSTLIILEHSSRDYGGLQSMASPVTFVCLSGLAVPSFAEYLFSSVPIMLLGPVQLFLLSSSVETIFSMLYQHALILALGASVTWTVHADHRRDWLRSRTAPARGIGSNGQRRGRVDVDSTVFTSSASEAATVGADGMDYDDFIATDSAEMRELARQVLCPMHSTVLLQCKKALGARRFAPVLIFLADAAPQRMRTKGPRGENAFGGGNRAAAQERAAAVARMAEPPDVVPRWYCYTIIGAGPAGYVYQVCCPHREECGLATAAPCGGQCASGALPLVRARQSASGPRVRQTPFQHTNATKAQQISQMTLGTRDGAPNRLP